MIHDPRALSAELHASPLCRLLSFSTPIDDHLNRQDVAGWYKPRQYYAIKGLLRLKWQALVEGKECSDDKVEEIMAQFNDFESAGPVYDDDVDNSRLSGAQPAMRAKRKPRKTRAKQSALDEQALAVGSRTYRGPLSDAAQQVCPGTMLNVGRSALMASPLTIGTTIARRPP